MSCVCLMASTVTMAVPASVTGPTQTERKSWTFPINAWSYTTTTSVCPMKQLRRSFVGTRRAEVMDWIALTTREALPTSLECWWWISSWKITGLPTRLCLTTPRRHCLASCCPILSVLTRDFPPSLFGGRRPILSVLEPVLWWSTRILTSLHRKNITGPKLTTFSITDVHLRNNSYLFKLFCN